MLYFNRTDVSERIDFYKITSSKERYIVSIDIS